MPRSWQQTWQALKSVSAVSDFIENEEILLENTTDTYLDGDLSIVEVDDYDIAELLGVCSIEIVIGGGILFEHLQSSAFDFYKSKSGKLSTFRCWIAAL